MKPQGAAVDVPSESSIEFLKNWSQKIVNGKEEEYISDVFPVVAHKSGIDPKLHINTQHILNIRYNPYVSKGDKYDAPEPKFYQQVTVKHIK